MNQDVGLMTDWRICNYPYKILQSW